MAKISKSAASKSYNQKTIAKIKARDAASSSSSSSSTKATTSSSSSSSQQLAAMKATLEKASADLKAGNVTGLSSTPATSSTPNANTINAGYAQALAQKSATGITTPAVSPLTSTTPNADTINAGYAQALKLKTDGTVPSTVITNGLTQQDVLNKRAEIEQKQGLISQYQKELDALKQASTMDPTATDINTMNPLTDPDKYLSQYFSTDASRNKTPAQLEQERLLNESAQTTEDFYANRDKNINKAYDEYGVTEKQKALSNIQKEMAQREVKLRNDVQVLETAPEYRGVSREFANDQRESIKSKGAFDLANLAIVESAYNGDLTQARSLSQDLIDNQFATFEGKIEGYKARLAALIPTLEGEEKKQALALEVAFDAQARAVAEKKADTELKYEYMTLAAQAGAPESVYKSILSATSADEAFMLAAPYMQKGTTSGGGSTGGASNVGGITPTVGLPQGLSTSADQVLKGLKSINDFTPSEKTKVQNELGALGFNNEEPAEWFGTDFLAGQGITMDQTFLEDLFKKDYARGLAPDVLEQVIQADVEKALKILWAEYRNYVFGTGGTSGESPVGSSTGRTK